MFAGQKVRLEEILDIWLSICGNMSIWSCRLAVSHLAFRKGGDAYGDMERTHGFFSVIIGVISCVLIVNKMTANLLLAV